MRNQPFLALFSVAIMGLGLSAGGCSVLSTVIGFSGGLGGFWLIVLIGYVTAVLLFMAGWNIMRGIDGELEGSMKHKAIVVLVALVLGALFFGGCFLALGGL